MKNLLALTITLLAILFFATTSCTQQAASQLYGTASWDADSLGNHRVVIRVDKKGDVAYAHIPWRRRDYHPEKKGLIMFDATTGKQVKNILPVEINREYGDILFQPVTVPGDYDIYYLKYNLGGHKNYPTVTYSGFNSLAQSEWLKKAESTTDNLQTFPKAKVIQFQAVNKFNSFYPMEVIATANEVSDLIAKNSDKEYLLFPEDRKNSIKMTNDIPQKWVEDGVTNSFAGDALRGEYYTFQVGVFANKSDLKNVTVEFSDLKGSGENRIAKDNLTCFNTEGTDWKGSHFNKELNVKEGTVQPLWMGVQIPEEIAAGDYEGAVTVKPKGMKATEVKVKLTVSEEKIVAGGDNEPGRLSRLRWLNSTIAADDGLVAPYTPLEVEGNSVKCLGREVVFGKNGFPEKIKSYFSPGVTSIRDESREILAAPMKFVVETNSGTSNWGNPSFKMVKQKEGAVAWTLKSEMPGFTMSGDVQMEFDGNIDYKLILTATKDMAVKDIRLEVPLKQEATKYMMGLGEKGGYRPASYRWKWKVENNQDGPWIGDVNAGVQVRFRDNHYSRPLNTNFYLKKPLYMPDSWCNDGNGGITITPKGRSTVILKSYSGKRVVKKGEQLHYYFNILITPFHPLETKKHWHNRYYHKYVPVDDVIAYGADVINVHHATEINPYINYPFLRPDEMKAYVDEAHSKDVKVKIYYTVRELTNRAPELFALRSLGDEIFSTGSGGGYSWLQEHLDTNYIAAWFVPSLKDAAIVNRGISRWHNFYIEGLNWLVDNIGIDGIYIDDLAFDRTSMKRIRKVLLRGNPGGLIDLHSANQFNPRDGFANSANLYLENLPYIDRLWFGEYFEYDRSPDYWLVEVSGIPFGLMGEMLQDGGNPWRGMVYGMTARAPWSGDPAPIWKVWDDFGIQNSEMTGYWVADCPVTTNNKNVKATVYIKEGKALISLGNWSKSGISVKLNINWSKLGIDKKSVKLTAPEVKDFQDAGEYAPGKSINVPGGKGLLLVLE